MKPQKFINLDAHTGAVSRPRGLLLLVTALHDKTVKLYNLSVAVKVNIYFSHIIPYTRHICIFFYN